MLSSADRPPTAKSRQTSNDLMSAFHPKRTSEFDPLRTLAMRHMNGRDEVSPILSWAGSGCGIGIRDWKKLPRIGHGHISAAR
jgi:hypothetical protein